MVAWMDPTVKVVRRWSRERRWRKRRQRTSGGDDELGGRTKSYYVVVHSCAPRLR